MAVEVSKQNDFAVVLQPPDHLLQVVDCRVLLLAWLYPDAIEVAPSQGASRVAIYDSIYIQHGHYFKHEVVSQDPRSQARTYQVVDDTFHHKAGVSLTRVDATGNNNALALPNGFSIRTKSGYDQHINRVAS